MTIAAERLAVIAALTLPITSLSSVMGMDVIVNDSTRWMQLIIFSLIMLAISLIPAALGPQTGLVVIIRAAQPVADSVRADRSRLRCVAYGWLCLASSPRMGTASSDSAYGT
ncbi:MAG: hypothetical protein ACJ72M_04000 [Propionibacteriaceae bacterium]